MATNTAHISASPQQVFGVLSDGWLYSNWVVGTSHMRAVESNWPEVGSKLFHASGVWPAVARDETEVKECVPDERLVLVARGRPFGEAVIAIELSEEDGGCRVVMHETPSAGPGKRLHNPLTEAILVRRNTEALARLAVVAERPTEPPS